MLATKGWGRRVWAAGSEIAARYRKLADRFTRLVESVPEERWDVPITLPGLDSS